MVSCYFVVSLYSISGVFPFINVGRVGLQAVVPVEPAVE